MYVCYWWEETRMSWEHFIYFAIAAVLLWAVGAWAAWKSKTGMAYATTVLGLLFFFSFILSMWISLERPPLRTMGETRLWYSFFLPLAGLIVSVQTGDTRQDADARPSESLVCATCYRLYVRLRRTRCGGSDGYLSALYQKE